MANVTKVEVRERAKQLFLDPKAYALGKAWHNGNGNPNTLIQKFTPFIAGIGYEYNVTEKVLAYLSCLIRDKEYREKWGNLQSPDPYLVWLEKKDVYAYTWITRENPWKYRKPKLTPAQIIVAGPPV